MLCPRLTHGTHLLIKYDPSKYKSIQLCIMGANVV